MVKVRNGSEPVKIGDAAPSFPHTWPTPRDIGFMESNRTRGGIEVITISDLLTNAVPGEFTGLQRPAFSILLFLTQGSLQMHIDFAPVDLTSGTLTLIHPSQLLAWGNLAAVQGFCILLKPESLSPEVNAVLPRPYEQQQSSWQLSPALARIFTAQCHYFVSLSNPAAVGSAGTGQTETAPAKHDDATTRCTQSAARRYHLSSLMLTHHLCALLVQLSALTPYCAPAPRRAPALPASPIPNPADPANPADTDSPPPPASFGCFQSLVDSHFTCHHKVDWYARELNLSARALRDICYKSFQKSPKNIIDQRIFLEAKRHLAHSTLTVSAIATTLGFQDSSNFARFFKHHQHQSPHEFRATARLPHA